MGYPLFVSGQARAEGERREKSKSRSVGVRAGRHDRARLMPDLEGWG